MHSGHDNLCVVVEDHLPDPICQHLIEVFEENKHLHQRIEAGGRPDFSQLEIASFLSDDQNQVLVASAFNGLRHYRDRVAASKFWPEKFSFELFRIKGYAGTDQFDTHVDVTNLKTSSRFLIFFWYLNDVAKGGETEIMTGSRPIKVKPKRGTLLMFPPFWMYPHKGHPVAEGHKYLLSSYLRFDDRS